MTDDLAHWFNRCGEAAPFTQQSILDPQSPLLGDVTSLHQEAFDGLVRLWSRPRSRLGRRGALVLGEIGSGKTHLLARLAQYAKRRMSLTWAVVPLDTDPAHNLRRALLDALLRAAPGDVAPIDQILRQLGTSLSSLGYVSNGTVTVPPTIWQAFEGLRHPDQRLMVLRWLRGQAANKPTTDSLFTRLGEMPDAIAVVAAIARLLQHQNALGSGLLLAFDHLDGLSDAALHRLDTLLSLIETHFPTAFVLLLASPTTWRQRCRRQLQSSRVSWLEQHVFELGTCRPEQSLQLIRARLSAVLEVEPDDLYPLDEASLRQQASGVTPRKVLQLAQQAVEAVTQLNPSAGVFPQLDANSVLQHAFNARRRGFLANPDAHPPNSDLLSLGVTLFLENHAPQATVKQREDGVWMWRADGSPWLMVMIDHAHYHSAVNANLQKAMSYQDEYWTVAYVRDSRWPIPQRWKASQDLLVELIERGGMVVSLSLNEAADWYALAHLDNAVAEGEVTVRAQTEPRPVTHREFSTFIATLIGLLEGFSALDAPLGIVHDAAPPPLETTTQVITDLLRVAPGAALLLNQLTNQLAGIEAEVLTRALADKRFMQLESREGTVVLLRRVIEAY